MVSIIDFHHAVGRNGDPVPLPPDLYPTDSREVRWFKGLPVRAVLAFVGVLIATLVPQIGRVPIETFAQRAGIGVLLIVGGTIGALAIMIVVPWAWWLFERKALGARLEAEIEALSLDDLNDRIAHMRTRLAESNSKQRDAILRRVVWMEKQRELLHGVAV